MKFAKRLEIDGHPLQKIQDLVETARRDTGGVRLVPFEVDEVSVRMPQTAQAASLLVRCELMLFSDVIARYEQVKTPPGMGGRLVVGFEGNRQRCEAVITEAEKSMSVKQQVEGRVYWAAFAALECGTVGAEGAALTAKTIESVEALKRAACTYLDDAERVADKLPAHRQALVDEIKEVREMVHDSTYKSEMRMVVTAMASEFSGTGHWYRCANGHPFTIGECGMPMEEARCPACGDGIGGQGHRAVEGVQHASDIEVDFGNVRL